MLTYTDAIPPYLEIEPGDLVDVIDAKATSPEFKNCVSNVALVLGWYDWSEGLPMTRGDEGMLVVLCDNNIVAAFPKYVKKLS